MAAALAGREAERLLAGDEHVTTGASNDIEKAAVIATRMVSEWGMLPASGEVCAVNQQQKEAAVRQWLLQAQQTAANVLTEHYAAWESLTGWLIEHETADGAQVQTFLQT